MSLFGCPRFDCLVNDWTVESLCFFNWLKSRLYFIYLASDCLFVSQFTWQWTFIMNDLVAVMTHLYLVEGPFCLVMVHSMRYPAQSALLNNIVNQWSPYIWLVWLCQVKNQTNRLSRYSINRERENKVGIQTVHCQVNWKIGTHSTVKWIEKADSVALSLILYLTIL